MLSEKAAAEVTVPNLSGKTRAEAQKLLEDANLDYEMTYCYVAFVRTEENETFFGDVQTFSTSVDPDGIEGVKADTEVTEVARYDLQGRRLSQPQNGLNIIRYSDGSSRKVWIK